jgi:hypothetical protein
MSQTFSLVCLECKAWIWVGQGWGSMTAFYTNPARMAQLQRFLNAHLNHTMRFVCDDATPFLFEDGWTEFEDPAMPERTENASGATS